MPTIPNWVPPVTPGGDLNTQDLQSEIIKTVGGDATVIPVAYGKVQVPGKVFAVVYDDVTDPNLPVWTIGVFWCFGEIHSMTATYLNGDAAVAGVSAEHYFGTTTQLKSPLMTAAKLVMGVTYADTLIIDDDRGTVGICYSVFQFDDEKYDTWPEFIAEIDGRKVYDPREAGHNPATPSTWAASETPALFWRDWVTSSMFGPGQQVDDDEVEIVADSNDETVTTEARRQCGLVINTRQNWETWRKILETYSGAWGYKRGTEWILKDDRPRSSDFTLTDESFVKDSFKVAISDINNIPTLVRIWFTDKTETIWRDRMVESELSGVAAGTVDRRTSEIKLPGIGRSTQALREATERLKKLNRFLQFQGTLLDDHIGIEPGDVVTITHKLGLSGVECRVIPFPGMAFAGRVELRAVRYSSSDYSDAETVETVLAESRFVGSLGSSPIIQLAAKKNHSDFSTANNLDVFVHGVTQAAAPKNSDGRVVVDGLQKTVSKGTVYASALNSVGYLVWDSAEAAPFTISGHGTQSLAFASKDSLNAWTYDDGATGRTAFDIAAAAFDEVVVIGTIETDGTKIANLSVWASGVHLSQIPHVNATLGAVLGGDGNVKEEDGAVVGNLNALNRFTSRGNLITDPAFADPSNAAWEDVSPSGFARSASAGEYSDPCMISANPGGSGTVLSFQQAVSKDILAPCQYGDRHVIQSRWWQNDTLTVDLRLYVSYYDEDLNLLHEVVKVVGSAPPSSWVSFWTTIDSDSYSPIQGSAFIHIRVAFYHSSLDRTATYKVQSVELQNHGRPHGQISQVIGSNAGIGTSYDGGQFGFFSYIGGEENELFSMYADTSKLSGNPSNIIAAAAFRKEDQDVGFEMYPNNENASYYNKDGDAAGAAKAAGMYMGSNDPMVFTNRAGTDMEFKVSADCNTTEKTGLKLLAAGALELGQIGANTAIDFTANDGVNEGGQFTMKGAAAHGDWNHDAYTTYLRWFKSGVKMTLKDDGSLGITGELSAVGVKVGAGMLNIAASVTLTMTAAGVVTATQSHHLIDTYAAASSDTLVTINGGVAGDLLFLGTVNSWRDVIVNSGGGNIVLQTGTNFTLSTTERGLTLKSDGTYWREVARA